MGAMLNNESIVNTIEKSIPSFVGLVPTKRIIIAKYAEPEDFVSASIYAEENKFLFIFKNSNIVLDFSSILSYRINDDITTHSSGISTNSTTNTNTGSMLGRSVAGAVVGGGVGAIIGGSTASKSTSSYTSGETITQEHNYTLYINLNCIISPTLKIKLKDCADQMNELVAILDVIIKKNGKTDNATEVKEISSVGKLYNSIKSDLIAENKKKEEYLELKRTESIRNIINEEDKKLSKNPIQILRVLFGKNSLIILLSIPLSIICALTYVWDWWMFFSYLLFLFALLFTFSISISMKVKSKNDKKEIVTLSQKRESFNMGFISAVLTFLMLIGFYPFILSSIDVCYMLSYWGIYVRDYEGGIIVSLLVVAFEVLSVFGIRAIYDDVRKNKIPYYSLLRYKLGIKYGIAFSLVLLLLVFSLFYAYGLKERRIESNYNSTYDESSIDTTSVSKPNNNTYKYHNKDTGEGQNNYKNSKEQENDLKITDELIEKEIENGSYD